MYIQVKPCYDRYHMTFNYKKCLRLKEDVSHELNITCGFKFNK